MKKLLGILGIFLVFACVLAFADFHSSITKVDYDEDSKILSFTTKMNVADLSQSLQMETKDPRFDAVTRKYVSDNFIVDINNSPTKLSFTGCQVNGQTVWVYFQCIAMGNIDNMRVRNTILIKEFSNQKNLIIVSYKGRQKTLNLQKGKEIGDISF